MWRWWANLCQRAFHTQQEACVAVGFAVVASAGVSAYAAPEHAEHLRSSVRVFWDRVAADATAAARVASEHVQTVRTALRKVPEAVYSVGSNDSRVALSVARSIADRASDADGRELLVRFGGSALLMWLVRHACDDATALQAECERSLAQLLEDADSAPQVLRLRGVGPSLLEHVASGKASAELVQSLHSAAARPTLSVLVHPSDIRRTLIMVQGRHGTTVQHLAAALLGMWGRSSPVNRRKLAACGAYATLSDIAMAASHEQRPADHALLHHLIQILDHAAHSEVAWEGPHLACWVQPALYVAADAAVAGDLALSQQALAAVRHLAVHGGEEVQQQLQRSPLLPLLRRLAQGGILCEEVVQIVGVLAVSGVLSVEEVLVWRDILLAWVLQPGAGPAVRQVCVKALAALSAPTSQGPNHVAYYWLAGILDHLAATLLAPRTQSDLLSSTPAEADFLSQSSGWQETVLVQPAYARWVAADLRLAVASSETAATARQGFLQPPAPLLELLGPEASAAYPAAARSVDAALAQQKLGSALEVLNRMVADSPPRQAILLEAGIIPLLSRLCLEQPPPAKPCPPLPLPDPSQSNFTSPPQFAAGTPLPSPAMSATSDLPGSPGAAAAPAATSSSGPPGRLRGLFTRFCPASKPATDETTMPFVVTSPAPSSSSAIDGDNHALHARMPHGRATTPTTAQVDTGQLQQEVDLAASADLWRAVAAGTGLRAEEEAASMQAAALLAAKQLEQEEAVEHPPAPLAIQRQAARLLALLCVQVASCSEARQQLEASDWLPWLEQAARSLDCALSSGATRALLHLAAAMLPTALVEQPASQLDGEVGSHGAQAICPDGVHLVTPDACHHWTLATGKELGGPQQGALAEFLTELLLGPDDDKDEAEEEGASGRIVTAAGQVLQRVAQRCTGAASEPMLDVVFVHGIRGGPFVTWRKREAGSGPGVAGRSSMRRDACWLSDWLAVEVPQARLLSVEYVAPVSFWEGESVPLMETARQLSKKLLAAGVGRRPVVFVGHSMGGLIVKEILAQALAELDQSFTHPPSRLRQTPQQWPAALMDATGATGAVVDAAQGRHWWQRWWGGASSGPSKTLAGDTMVGSVATSGSATAIEWPVAAAVPVELHAAPNVGRGTGVWGSAGATTPAAEGLPAASSGHSPGATAGHSGASAPGPSDAATDPAASQKLARAMQTISRIKTLDAMPLAFSNPATFPDSKPATLHKHLLSAPPTSAHLSSDHPPSGRGYMPGNAPSVSPMRTSDGEESTDTNCSCNSSCGTEDSSGRGKTLRPTLQPLLSNTRAIVFYSTPHFGSSLAAYGWKLRYIGGAPAPSVAYLSPGPHLEHLNNCLRRLHGTQNLQVLSICEGLPTQLAGFMPQVHIVPPYSSNPGFGEVAVVQEDHIACCKPSSKEDPIFVLILQCIQSVIADLES